MPHTDPRHLGAELNQLARLLFDAAANKWYLAAVLEVGAGLLAGVLAFLDLPGTGALIGAAIGTVLLIIAYILHLFYEDQQDVAETMRMRAAFIEGLGELVSQTQASKWREKAGPRIRQRAKQQPREADYYATKEPPSPKRLAEMTIESAFWTRTLYDKLQRLVWWGCGLSGAIFVIVTLVSLTQLFPNSVEQAIARFLYSLIPVMISANFLGWGLRLGRLSSNIEKTEEDLDKMKDAPNLTDAQVLRLVAEYNRQTAIGFPIHNWLFKRWHNEISDLWKSRADDSTQP